MSDKKSGRKRGCYFKYFNSGETSAKIPRQTICNRKKKVLNVFYVWIRIKAEMIVYKYFLMPIFNKKSQ